MKWRQMEQLMVIVQQIIMRFQWRIQHTTGEQAVLVLLYIVQPLSLPKDSQMKIKKKKIKRSENKTYSSFIIF